MDKNITNTRYPGFSQFHSPNSLQNSSYCYTIPRDIRIKDKGFKKLGSETFITETLKNVGKTDELSSFLK